MTIVIPKPNLIDKLLRGLGKKRGVAVHAETTDPTGTQTYYAPKKESPLRAFLRPSGKTLPHGMIDVFTLQLKSETTGTGTRTLIRESSFLWGPIAIPSADTARYPSLR